MTLWMDRDEMRAFQHREEHGHLPDDVYTPTPEDDPHDPENQEIGSLVVETYDEANRRRLDRRLHDRIAMLEAALTEHGIEIPTE